MKKQILNSLTTAFFLSLMIFVACGPGTDDDEVEIDERQEQFDRLAKTWSVTSAQADGTDIDGWTDLTITFAGTATSGSLSTNGSQPDGTTRVWNSPDTWNFASEDDLNTIVRGDGVQISLAVDNAGTSATLTFNIAADGGRQDVVEGAWRFQLTAN
mgnify:CR=1 FL=1